ncbi:hypothetical protein G7Y89_g10696 [Cudoniella acicularis]|uniref:Uncharacterized protein n=1 Tax=Cudoniella acicularis TaxID=354080 RepID=A0A8H4REZ6_9HELO|nr:hypothetical protein G7Y89_g10696 [Cudoniella acicularis]
MESSLNPRERLQEPPPHSAANHPESRPETWTQNVPQLSSATKGPVVVDLTTDIDHVYVVVISYLELIERLPENKGVYASVRDANNVGGPLSCNYDLKRDGTIAWERMRKTKDAVKIIVEKWPLKRASSGEEVDWPSSEDEWSDAKGTDLDEESEDTFMSRVAEYECMLEGGESMINAPDGRQIYVPNDEEYRDHVLADGPPTRFSS